MRELSSISFLRADPRSGLSGSSRVYMHFSLQSYTKEGPCEEPCFSFACYVNNPQVDVGGCQLAASQGKRNLRVRWTLTDQINNTLRAKWLVGWFSLGWTLLATQWILVLNALKKRFSQPAPLNGVWHGHRRGLSDDRFMFFYPLQKYYISIY